MKEISASGKRVRREMRRSFEADKFFQTRTSSEEKIFWQMKNFFIPNSSCDSPSTVKLSPKENSFVNAATSGTDGLFHYRLLACDLPFEQTNVIQIGTNG